MATKQLQLQCAGCEAVMPHTQPAPNHILHLLLTIFTAGLWLIVWIIIAMSGGGKATCSKCGNKRLPTGAATRG
jgi:hypothetical protein